MTERPRFFDDLAGVAGGAFSALAGLREEAESTIRARVDEAIRRLDLVKREDLEAVQDMAAAARAGQERAEARLTALEARLAELSVAHAAATPTSSQPVPNQAAPGHEPPPAAMPGAAHEAGSAPPPPSID